MIIEVALVAGGLCGAAHTTSLSDPITLPKFDVGSGIYINQIDTDARTVTWWECVTPQYKSGPAPATYNFNLPLTVGSANQYNSAPAEITTITFPIQGGGTATVTFTPNKK